MILPGLRQVLDETPTPVLGLCPGIAIDLGSSRTRAWMPGRGVVADVPSVALSPDGPCYPVRRGRVVDVEQCSRMLGLLLGRHVSRRRRRPLVVLSGPVLTKPADHAAALAALEVLEPRSVLTLDSVKAAAVGCPDEPPGGRSLLVVDVGAHLTEVAVLTDGTVVGARRAEVGTADLGRDRPAALIADAVAGMVTQLLRDADAAGTVDALDRGPLLVGGGALRPDIAYRLAMELRTSVRPAPAPHWAALRGAAVALQAARRHPSVNEGEPVVSAVRAQ
ncbi:rod shape-determining protein [Peterkaempfera bronchialis]|uniref:rod shape-determining protein n=1 Tax=Peterkaempfera bronchialis TaxID=2126346 RepID=UPI003C2FA604